MIPIPPPVSPCVRHRGDDRATGGGPRGGGCGGSAVGVGGLCALAVVDAPAAGELGGMRGFRGAEKGAGPPESRPSDPTPKAAGAALIRGR